MSVAVIANRVEERAIIQGPDDPARNYRDGDLLLHFAGVGDSDRIEQLMRHHHAHTRVTDLPRAVQGRRDGGWVRALVSRFRGP
jgi:hypothetical protein